MCAGRWVSVCSRVHNSAPYTRITLVSYLAKLQVLFGSLFAISISPIKYRHLPYTCYIILYTLYSIPILLYILYTIYFLPACAPCT